MKNRGQRTRRNRHGRPSKAAAARRKRRKAAKQRKLKAEMFRSVMSACSSVILSFLPLRELPVLDEIGSAFLCDCCSEEVLRRIRMFPESASLAWTCSTGECADDVSFKAAINDKLSRHSYWRRNPLRNHRFDLFDRVVNWNQSSNWGTFLLAREEGAQLQPPVEEEERAITLTPDEAYPLPPMMLIFDIHRDERHTWTGIYPFGDDDLDKVIVRDDVVSDDEDDEYVGLRISFQDTSGFRVCPFSPLGEPTDKVLGINNTVSSQRPNRFLFSTDSDDERGWEFSISIISPECKETHVLSHTIVPSEVKGPDLTADDDENSGWEKYQDNLFFKYKKHAIEDIEGLEWGMVHYNIYSISLGVTFWYDARGSAPRFHANVDFCGPDFMFHHMLVNNA